MSSITQGYLRFPVKVFELRDRATFIPIIATRLLVRDDSSRRQIENYGGIPQQFRIDDYKEEFLLRRAGYSQEGITHLGSSTYVLLAPLSGGRCEHDPYSWGGRTYPVAHQYIVNHWDELVSGQVIDVEFILGETTEPKTSERGF